MTETDLLQQGREETTLDTVALSSVSNFLANPITHRRQPITEDLPFTVRIVRTTDQLHQVCQLRSNAYGMRNPVMGAKVAQPEAADSEPGTVVLLVESKKNGEVIGTLRIHTNLFQPVPMEGVIDLPHELQGQLVAEACRYCIQAGNNNALVRLALFKAIYLYCYANQVQHILCVARKPLNKMYKSLGFKPINGGEVERWEPVSYVGNILHSMLKLDILRVDSLWYETGHPCYHFVRRTFHPDIQIFSAAGSK